MPEFWSRRDFLRSAASGLAASTVTGIPHPMRPPRPLPPESRWAAKPVAIASANGLRAVQKAFDLLMQGADTLDAVIQGVKIQELDPNDDSVGYGGLPNAEGVVQLAASCMHGPTNRDAVTPQGDLSSVTTTSGLSWKIPGRVGDSPIIGAGQYCDNDVGAAGSTGLGEANIKVCGGFLTVEHMRRGMKPTDACLETLKRVVAETEARLLDAQGKPKFDLVFYALTKRGEFGAASLYPNHFAAHDGVDAKIRDTAY